MNEPLVSVVIPCYNHAHFLPETLRSVISQTYKNWECIIVDDGSTDNTKEVVQSWALNDSRFRYLDKGNGGLADTRNFGIKNSNGKYILPLDSDDLIGEVYLEKAVKILEQNNSIGIVYCKAKLFGDQNGIWYIPKFSFKRHLTHNTIFCTAFFRRIDYDKTIGYNTNLIYGYEDWDFWLSLLEVGVKVYRIPDFLFFYRIRNRSMRNSINWDQIIFLNQRIIKNHIDLYQKNFKNPEIIIEYLEFRKNLPKGTRINLLLHFVKHMSFSLALFILKYRLSSIVNFKRRVFLH
jgi:glycosyltransferase involved in cell wall biosynthesis